MINDENPIGTTLNVIESEFSRGRPQHRSFPSDAVAETYRRLHCPSQFLSGDDNNLINCFYSCDTNHSTYYVSFYSQPFSNKTSLWQEGDYANQYIAYNYQYYNSCKNQRFFFKEWRKEYKYKLAPMTYFINC